jgi:GMP synthase (glutamine-hydrolysing)
MSTNVVIVNTHPTENPEFVDTLVKFLDIHNIKSEAVEGYQGVNPLKRDPSHIMLSGVPLSVEYSLTEAQTQRGVTAAFGWLKECKCPVLGICYGHQILAHIFGGKISSLEVEAKDEKFPLKWKKDKNSGIFSDIENLVVFAEHMDYISQVPHKFIVPCQKEEVPYIMYYPGRDIYGVQFVPERSDLRSREVLKCFVNI